MSFDAETARRLLKSYLTDDVIEQRRAIRTALALERGEDVLDIGSGPGLLAGEMAREVGPDGSVTGVDPSDEMLAIARSQHAADDARLTYFVGQATELPVPAAGFDAVTSTQVYEYVADMPAALAEARRVLRPGGRLLILDTDWDSIVWRSGDDSRMRRVLTAWDEHLVDPYLPRRLPSLLREAGFALTSAQVIPLLNLGYRANTYSAALIGFVTAFVPGRLGVDANEVAAWAADLRGLGDDYFCSLNRYLFVATAP
ncbi:MAG: arsenite methyltransferase [Pseudonocardiales bacterium]|nr:arsenite methyltransferase [Pseudonocardiales bacterium]